MRQAIVHGQPFETAYSTFSGPARGDPALTSGAAPLADAARDAVPSRTALRRGLECRRQARPHDERACGGGDMGRQALDRTLGLVTIRRIGLAGDHGPRAAVDAARSALADGDLGAAVAALDRVGSADAKAAKPWLRMARTGSQPRRRWRICKTCWRSGSERRRRRRRLARIRQRRPSPRHRPPPPRHPLRPIPIRRRRPRRHRARHPDARDRALIAIAALVVAAVFLADHPGQVEIVWQGWQIETSVGVLIAAAVVAALAVALLLWLITGSGSPRALLRRRRERRRRAGYQALTRGMVAVAAGDPQEARRHAAGPRRCSPSRP